jgi:hypothetical protein
MLIPQFSLRSVLYVTAGCAVLSLVAAMAMRGTAWAMALTVAVASLSITFAAYGTMFFAVWVFSLVAPRRRAARELARSSPFGPDR